MPEQKKAVVPRLRFPEFRDAGPWEVKRLETIVELAYGAALPESHRNKGDVPVVGSNGIVGYHDKPLTKGPTIVIGRKGSAGEVTWVEEACFPIDTTFFVQFRRSLDSPRFLYFLLLTLNLPELARAEGVPGLNRNDVYSRRVGVPSATEQQKIADCLSSLDELIELQAKQLEALQAHKKGLMQQLFPREGETTPRLRFPEFRDAGPWEVKRLGEICSFLKGKGLPKTAITAEGSVPCIHYGELFTEYGEVIRKVKSCTNTTTDSVLSEEDDVLMPTSDVTPNGLAKASCIKEKNVVLGGDILVIRPNKQQVFGEYLSRYIRYQEKDVLRLVTGTTVFHLYGNAISHLRVSLPRMSEQQKIADCLSSLDELIELQAKQLEALQAHKKGLMQQLFPQEVG